MDYLSKDFLIVYAFLIVTLIIGIRAGRGIKNIREYAIANKTFGTGALVLTLLATYIAGASVLNISAQVFSEGIIIIAALGSLSINFLILALFIAPKFARFDDCLSMGDLMKKFYGKKSGIIAGLLGTLNAVLLVGMELIILGIIGESLLDIPAKWGIIGGGILLSVYSAHGGIKSVTMTDIFQFIMLAVCIPMIAYVAVGKIGGVQAVLQQVPSEKLAIFSHKSFSFYLTLFSIWIIPSGAIDPAIIQRLLMAKRGSQLRNQYLVVAAFDPVFQLVIMLIGLSAVILYPNIEAKQVVPHLIQELLPVGLKGLAIAGVLAVGMSTIDSYLHAAGLTLAHDVLVPIWKRKHKPINELRWARYATIFIGLVGIGIALKAKKNHEDILGLAFSALEFVSPLLMFPLFAGVLGLKTDQRSFYTAFFVTLLAFVVAKLGLPAHQAHFSVLITMATNGFTFFGMHAIQNKGFAVIKHGSGQEVVWKPRRKDLMSLFKAVFPTPKKVVAYSQEKVATYGAPYVLFGVFALINYTLPYFIWIHGPNPHENTMIYLRVIGGLLCVLLIVKEKWTDRLLPYMPVFWHFSILYCLPFTSTVMFFLTGGSPEWVVNVFAVIILLLVLLDWMTAIILGVLGIVLGILFCQFLVGDLHVSISFSSKYLMVYQGIFGILIGLIFARRRQLTFNRLATERDYMKAKNQENYSRLAEVFSYRDELLKELQSEGGTLFSEVTLDYLKQAVYRMTDYLRLDVTNQNIDELLSSIMTMLENQGPLRANAMLPQKFTKHTDIQADINKLKQMFLNAVNYIQAYNTENKPITIALEDATLGHEVAHMKGYTRKLEALKITITTASTLPLTKDVYMIDPSQPSTWAPKHEAELPLIENACIVDAHYGHADMGNLHTHVYVIPVHLREVRGKVMELLREPSAADPAELKHPIAMQLEKSFFAKLAGTPVDLALIRKALDIIKRYHGGIKRKSGEPFFTHPMAVALILLDYSNDQDAIIAALLHDIVEDTSLSIVHIRAIFGDTVAFLVGKATNLEDHERRLSLDDHENLYRISNYEDERAALVKLADRLHNMRTIQGHPSLSKQKRIAKETLNFFVPLAKHIERMDMASELEQRSMEVLEKNE